MDYFLFFLFLRLPPRARAVPGGVVRPPPWRAAGGRPSLASGSSDFRRRRTRRPGTPDEPSALLRLFRQPRL